MSLKEKKNLITAIDYRALGEKVKLNPLEVHEE